MKRIIIGSLLLVMMLVFTGCKEEDTSDSLLKEIDRITELIPEVFDSNIDLPLSSAGFEVEYFVDGENIENTLFYELLSEDKDIIINIVVSHQEKSEESNITVRQIVNVEKYYDTIFDTILMNIPGVMFSDVTLPVFENNEVLMEYSTDCTTIERNRLIYTEPLEEIHCSLYVKGEFVDKDRETEVSFIMSAINDLPKLPAIYITTVNRQEITTKDTYVPGYLTLEIEGESRFPEIQNAELGIRLRGNSTSTMPKKAYKIKFEDKQALLSNYKEKRWVLLANHVDQTLLRNYLAFSMASKLDMDFVPSFTFVDVYINGDYQGNYLLTDQIEVTNDRVDIEEKEPNLNTGYLVEYDLGLFRETNVEMDENYFMIDGIPFVIKSPDIEKDYYQQGQKDFIEQYFNTVLDTLKNKGNYSSLIDEDSFIDWFIVNEVFKNVDSGYSSIYFYKDKDGLLKLGPVWDFDISSGVPGYVNEELRGPTGWWTSREDKNVFFYHLLQYPSFRENLKERWNEVYDDAIYKVLDETLDAKDLITQSSYYNFEMWDIIGSEESWYTSPEVLSLQTYDEQVWFLYDYLKTRIEWMNQEINKF